MNTGKVSRQRWTDKHANKSLFCFLLQLNPEARVECRQLMHL